MTLHQLRIFHTVARLGNFSRAAEELGISQPSVSIQVGDLERSLGVDLFEQRGKRIYLTEAGETLEGFAQRILELMEQASAAVRRPHPRSEPSAAGPEEPPSQPEHLPFEVIEHTADVGIIARGATLPEVFANAAAGMMSFIIQPALVRPRETRRAVVEAEDRDALLVAWLNELLVLLNGDGFIPRKFRIVELSDTRLEADVLGEPVDPQRHKFRLDVKAATYHQLEISRNDGWHAKVIFDV
ncbi:MAG TPA: archease [bacterium]|nr:archease [bacterium]